MAVLTAIVSLGPYEVPPECPSAESFARELEGLSVGPSGEGVSVRVDKRAGRYEARLRFGDDSGAVNTQDHDCGAALRSLALLGAIALDPFAEDLFARSSPSQIGFRQEGPAETETGEEEQVEAEGEQGERTTERGRLTRTREEREEREEWGERESEREEQAETTLKLDGRGRTREVERPGEAGPEQPRAEQRRAPWRGRAGFGGLAGVDFQYAPGLFPADATAPLGGFGARARLGLTRPWLRSQLLATVVAGRFRDPTGIGGANLVAWAGGVEVCALPAWRALEFPVCGSVFAGAMHARGIGVNEPQRVVRPWLGAELHAAVAWWVRPRLSLELRAGVGTSLLRPSFASREPAARYVAPAVYGSVGPGISGRF